jgi:hypothetical protein
MLKQKQFGNPKKKNVKTVKVLKNLTPSAME